MTRIRVSRGFALVEAIVGALVSLVVAIAILAIMGTYNREAREGSQTARAEILMENAADLLGRDIQAANAALAPGETWADDLALAVATPLHIRLFGAGGTAMREYRIEGNVLQVKETGANSPWTNVDLGGGQTLNFAAGGFSLSNDRKRVRVWFRPPPAGTYQLPARGGMFLCRN